MTSPRSSSSMRSRSRPSPKASGGTTARSGNLLKPHFKGVKVTDIDARFLLELRQKRADTKTKNGTNVKPTTLKKDLVFVRLVLQHAKEWEKCLDELPEFPSFRGDAWAVLPSPRPFLNHEQWTKVRDLAKERGEGDRAQPANAATAAGVVLVPADLRRCGPQSRGSYSLRWRDCDLTKLDDADKTDAVHMMVLGKHSRGGKREDAYGLFGAVSAFKAMQAARPDAKPDDPLFLENHREGMKELLYGGGTPNRQGRTHPRREVPSADGHLFALGHGTRQHRLPRRCEVGADEPRDDRHVLRSNSPESVRRQDGGLQESTADGRGAQSQGAE